MLKTFVKLPPQSNVILHELVFEKPDPVTSTFEPTAPLEGERFMAAAADAVPDGKTVRTNNTDRTIPWAKVRTIPAHLVFKLLLLFPVRLFPQIILPIQEGCPFKAYLLNSMSDNC